MFEKLLSSSDRREQPRPTSGGAATTRDTFEAAKLTKAQLDVALPTDKAEADRRAAAAVQTVKSALESASVDVLPQLRANAKVAATSLRNLGYTTQADQIDALATPVSYNMGAKATDGRFAKNPATEAKQAAWAAKVGGDPRELNAVRAYFKKLPASEVQGQLDDYLKTFYVHPGNGVVKWDGVTAAERNGLDQPGALTAMMKAQPRDDSGRTMTNCVGFTLVAGSILKGRDDLDVRYAGNSSHMWLIAAQKSDLKNGATSRFFTVSTLTSDGSNDYVQAQTRPAALPLERYAAGASTGTSPGAAWCAGD